MGARCHSDQTSRVAGRHGAQRIAAHSQSTSSSSVIPSSGLLFRGQLEAHEVHALGLEDTLHLLQLLLLLMSPVLDPLELLLCARPLLLLLLRPARQRVQTRFLLKNGRVHRASDELCDASVSVRKLLDALIHLVI